MQWRLGCGLASGHDPRRELHPGGSLRHPNGGDTNPNRFPTDDAIVLTSRLPTADTPARRIRSRHDSQHATPERSTFEEACSRRTLRDRVDVARDTNSRGCARTDKPGRLAELAGP